MIGLLSVIDRQISYRNHYKLEISTGSIKLLLIAS